MQLIQTACSTLSSPSDAASDLKRQVGDGAVHTLIYFASSSYDHAALASGLAQAFPKAFCLGCSTSGEIISGKMLKNAVVAMAFHEDAIADMHIEVLEHIDRTIDVARAFDGFEKHFGRSMGVMDHERYVGLILMDGLSRAEEALMDKIGDLTNVTFIGGSAGDDLKFQKTFVSAQGKTYEHAAVLALMKPSLPFGFIKTQSFTVTEKTLTVTRSNPAEREVLEFDGKPAAQAYADALGETVTGLEDRFMVNPLGLLAGGVPFVRSPQQIKDGHVVFYCNMMEGMELAVLESTDIVRETQAALREKERDMGTIRGIINFNCILRTLDLEKRGQSQAYADVFKHIPTVGFSTYGEAFIGHINQTATMLVFG
ncbi:FIST N-terminal domain-containing protein [Desulfatiferula olefinivorans]